MSEPRKTQEHIRENMSRNTRALELRPSTGQGTVKTRVELSEGLKCEVVEGPFRFVVDSGAEKGTTPMPLNPGALGRASLGSCIAVAYAMWAAKLEVPIDGLEVDLETDYDARGMYGLDDSISPAYTEARYTVTVHTAASEEEVQRLADTADKYCTFLQVWTQPQKLVRDLRIERPGEGA